MWFPVTLSNLTFVCTFFALMIATALALADPFCNLDAPGLPAFFPANAFTFRAALAPGFGLPATFLATGFLALAASLAFGLAAVPATFLATTFFSPAFLASAGFLAAAAFLSPVAGFLAPAVAGFFAAGFLSSVAGRFGAALAAAAGFLSAGFFSAAGFLSAAGLAGADFFSAAGFLALSPDGPAAAVAVVAGFFSFLSPGLAANKTNENC